MTDVSPLSTAFIVERPQAAAKILADLDPEDAGSLFGGMPGRIAAPAMAAMPPLNAAKCAVRMPVEKAVGVFQNMPFQSAASVLRLIGESERRKILMALPRGRRLEFLRSLKYPPETVGAWMDQSITPLNHEQTVAEALRYARRKDRQAGDKVFVVDASHTYLGIIKIADLLLLDGKTPLSRVLEDRSRVISSRSSLAVLAADDSWSDAGSMAVVGRKGNLLGVVTWRQVRNGLDAIRGTSTGTSGDSILAHLFAALLVMLSGTIGLWADSSSRQQHYGGGETRDEG